MRQEATGPLLVLLLVLAKAKFQTKPTWLKANSCVFKTKTSWLEKKHRVPKSARA